MRVEILLVVDTTNLLTDPNPHEHVANYVYLIDNTKQSRGGAFGEGGNELISKVRNGDVVQWSAVSVDADFRLDIAGFAPYRQGETDYAFDRDKGIAPMPRVVNGAGVREYWHTAISAHENQVGKRYQYSILFTVNGVTYSWDPFLLLESY